MRQTFENELIRRAEPKFSLDSLRSAELLSNLIHRIGHDVGNPLTAIISLASIIERFNSEMGMTPDKLRNYANSIVEEAWRITELSERLVMLFSAKPGNSEPVSITQILERSAKRLKQRKAGLQIGLQITTADQAPSHIFADPEQLLVLFSELFTNARRELTAVMAREQHSTALPPIQIHISDSSSQAKIAVRNLTISKNPLELEKLFEPLVTTHEHSKFLGLGLTVCLAIVKRFGGTIALQEEKFGDIFQFVVEICLPKTGAA